MVVVTQRRSGDGQPREERKPEYQVGERPCRQRYPAEVGAQPADDRDLPGLAAGCGVQVADPHGAAAGDEVA